MTTYRRSSSLGCLGVFAGFTLILMTAINLAALWWLDPQWVDARAWWKPAPLPANVVYKSDADTFQGTWNGKIFLVEGSFVEPVVKDLRTKMDKELDTARAQVARMPADQQAKAQGQIDMMTKQMAVIEKAARWAGQIARIGVPVKVHITRGWGGYEMQVRNIVWNDVSKEKNTKFAMWPAGDRTLSFKPQENLPAMDFRLHRPNEVRVVNEIRDTATDGSTKSFAVRLVLYREATAAVP